ncbi:hypothetical protein [Pelotalea chapellei]|uniref:LAGLIDADG homing endonuclease n=1 Tax=Pelotalea chapellei TaxID=44671 RepID=A0ABS5U7H3_9BACT|nr:hypothetical protein [Pelotalea chapellei]MBT1071620.1 hypothetical protein [Pelotalea chapellei]
MAPHHPISKLPCDVKMIESGLYSVTFIMPESQISPFVGILNSLTDLLQGLSWRVKTNIDGIHARNAVQQIKNDEILVEYEKHAVTVFQTLVNKGNSPRESLSMTVSKVHEKFPFSSFDSIKKILTKNKLLKNTGFYKSK